MNPLFDAIKEYMDARDAVGRSVVVGLDQALSRRSTAEANLRTVCAGVCRVDGEGLPGSTPPDNDGEGRAGTFNLNQFVVCTLTPHGVEVFHESDHGDASKLTGNVLREQAWVVMNIFGWKMFNGAKPIFVDNVWTVEPQEW